mgnify:CR=1 FL=1
MPAFRTITFRAAAAAALASVMMLTLLPAASLGYKQPPLETQPVTPETERTAPPPAPPATELAKAEARKPAIDPSGLREVLSLAGEYEALLKGRPDRYDFPDLDENAVAIIGMAGRFPGARNLEEFWANLRNGVESVHRFTDEELAEIRDRLPRETAGARY